MDWFLYSAFFYSKSALEAFRSNGVCLHEPPGGKVILIGYSRKQDIYKMQMSGLTQNTANVIGK